MSCVKPLNPEQCAADRYAIIEPSQVLAKPSPDCRNIQVDIARSAFFSSAQRQSRRVPV